MGLELVEVVMAVEEEFGIEIPDEVAGAMVAPAHMHAYLVRRLDAARPLDRSCPNLLAFNTVRRALRTTLPVRRSDVRLDTRLDTLFPVAGRKDAWRSFARSLPWLEPRLEFPRAYLPAIWLSLFATTTCAAAFACGTAGLVYLAVAIGGFALLPTLLASALPGPRREFPNGIQTVRDLVRRCAAVHCARPAPISDDPGEQEIWDRMARVIAGQAGVEQKQVRPDSRWSDLLDC